MKKLLLHLFDILAVISGATLVVGGLTDLEQVNAEVMNAGGASFSLLQPMLMVAGIALISLPATRRLLFWALMNPSNIAECGDMGRALQRIGLMERVQAGNLYATELDEEGFVHALDGEEGMWQFLGPAYRDPQLREQFDPALLTHLQALAEKHPEAVQG